jgi:hypothetical protein
MEMENLKPVPRIPVVECRHARGSTLSGNLNIIEIGHLNDLSNLALRTLRCLGLMIGAFEVH